MSLQHSTLSLNKHKKCKSIVDIEGNASHIHAIQVYTRLDHDPENVRSRQENLDRLIACWNAFKDYPTSAINYSAVKPYTGDHTCESAI